MPCKVFKRINEWGAPLPRGLTDRAMSAAEEHRFVICAALGEDGSAWEVRPAGSFLTGTATVCSSDVDLHAVRVDRFAYALPADPAQRRWVKQWLDDSVPCGFGESRAQIEAAVMRCYGACTTLRPKAIHVDGTPRRLEADIVVAMEHRRYTGYADSAGQPAYIPGVEFRTREDPCTPVVCYPALRRQAIEQHDRDARGRSRSIMRIMKCVRHAMRNSGDPVLSGATAKVPPCLIEAMLCRVPAWLYWDATDGFWATLRQVLPTAIEMFAAPNAVNIRDLGDVQSLFGEGQTWSREGALRFLRLAWSRLEEHDLPLF